MNVNKLNEDMEFILKKDNKEINVKDFSPLVLAYIGDAVFEVLVRSKILSFGNTPVNIMNRKTIKFVNAKSQSNMYFKIKDILTEEEKTIFRRGRNAKSNTIPKNANIFDYKHATGLESVIGYLYLSNNMERALEIFNVGFNSILDDLRK